MAAESVPVNDLKSHKYDRQLRLWAATGQTALESAKVCLLRATSTGCEILKNLVLPGVGSITIVDDAFVEADDVRNNFFLETKSIGSSKAQATSELLKELNEDVSASFVHKPVADIIANESEFFDPYSLIIATNLSEEESLALADICHRTSKPVFIVFSKGLCGMFRLQAPEHPVIETHPENLVDLRLGCAFKELLDYVDTFNLDELDQTDHAHVPFVVVLLTYLKDWKATHDGQMPESYSERNEFKELIKSGMRTADEENFEEAIANVWRLASPSTVTSNIREIFEDPACDNLTAESNSFWVIARAVRDFVANEGEGQLPLPGKLPDMKSDTANYVKLQNVYRDKALKDMAAIKSRVKRLLEDLNAPADSIPETTIESFCKNAAYVKLLRYRSLSEEYQKPQTKKIVTALESSENIIFYVILRAADKFNAKHGRYPGSKGGNKETDADILRGEVLDTMVALGIPRENADTISSSDNFLKAIINFVRFADHEVANMAALLGGLVAQEAIKIITRQYTPINNTCIFNGIASTSNVYEL